MNNGVCRGAKPLCGESESVSTIISCPTSRTGGWSKGFFSILLIARVGSTARDKSLAEESTNLRFLVWRHVRFPMPPSLPRRSLHRGRGIVRLSCALLMTASVNSMYLIPS